MRLQMEHSGPSFSSQCRQWNRNTHHISHVHCRIHHIRTGQHHTVWPLFFLTERFTKNTADSPLSSSRHQPIRVFLISSCDVQGPVLAFTKIVWSLTPCFGTFATAHANIIVTRNGVSSMRTQSAHVSVFSNAASVPPLQSAAAHRTTNSRNTSSTGGFGLVHSFHARRSSRTTSRVMVFGTLLLMLTPSRACVRHGVGEAR